MLKAAGCAVLLPWMQIVVACLLTQMNYLNKSLDLFNTAIVSPIYYVMFTLLTIIASVIMLQVRCWDAAATSRTSCNIQP